MCNIAGYIGDKQAAPILLEMLKNQEIYDAGGSAGIATIHEGKLYYKKFLGNAKELEKEIDFSELPGTIGIAHVRPARTYLSHSHPYVSLNRKLAMVSNGTTPYDEELIERRNKFTNDLYEKGYDFETKHIAETSSFPQLKSGEYISAMDVVVNLAQEYIKNGYAPLHAQTKALDDMYSERVGCMINADEPDYIGVVRLSRPMEILMAEGETYIATTRFGFPGDVKGDVYSLPVQHCCKVTRSGFEVMPYKAETDTVAEITPDTYSKAYKKVEEMLLNATKENPVIYDDVEITLSKMPELWDEQHKISQYAKVGYDILWQIHKEGRMKTFITQQQKPAGWSRDLIAMYID